jgi:hypothetical protein
LDHSNGIAIAVRVAKFDRAGHLIAAAFGAFTLFSNADAVDTTALASRIG